MAQVLLFNFSEEKRRRSVKALLFRLGIPARDVGPEEQGRTLKALLEGKDGENAGPEAGVFSGEMIVMHELSPLQFHGFLDGMKARGIRVALKAVTTEENLGWTAARLREELRAEEAALKAGGRGAHQG